jgi:hypothetical protein
VVSFTSRPLYLQGKSPSYPLDRKPGKPQSQRGHSGEEKNSQPLPGIKPLIIQPRSQHYTKIILQWIVKKQGIEDFTVLDKETVQ